MDTQLHSDQPINLPIEDRFGIDPFARALAISIRKLRSPKGCVIALNGPWGSGKSSAANLIRHHLADAVKDDELAVIDFACWWFRGEEALALAFFRELYAGLAPSLGEQTKKSLPKLGARLLRAGSVFGGVADAAGAGGLGTATGGMMEWIGNLIQQDESVEKLHDELSKALDGQKKRFLVVIDDIDRLSPDEALLIFRLVKSVGRLPNVMYLLVYDRQLAEKVVSERYPSEGPHYLEKIVQAAFELPEPTATDIQQHLLELINNICGQPDDNEIVRFMNIFYEGIAPEMRTPRDVIRLTNSLTVTWPAVAGEVNIADFIALEVIRLFNPATHRAIRQNKELLCRSNPDDSANRDARAKQYSDLLFGSTQEIANGRLRRVLMRLFPVLESAWSNMGYGDGFARQWALERRVCSSVHFDSYFRFSVGDDALSRAELTEFMGKASDQDYVVDTMRHAIKVTRKTGGTRASIILTELNTHADQINKEKVLPLLSALFKVADEINVDADESLGFGFGNNQLRLHWLLRSLTRDRMTLEERSNVLLRACEGAAVGWLADITSSAWADYYPGEGKIPEPPENCLLTMEDATYVRNLLRERIEATAQDGTLANNRDLRSLLYEWNNLANDGGVSVRTWTAALCVTDIGVRQLAVAFTSYSWSQSMGYAGLGDLVAKRSKKIHIKWLEEVVDIDEFRKRAEAVAASGMVPEVADFIAAWRASEGE